MWMRSFLNTDLVQRWADEQLDKAMRPDGSLDSLSPVAVFVLGFRELVHLEERQTTAIEAIASRGVFKRMIPTATVTFAGVAGGVFGLGRLFGVGV